MSSTSATTAAAQARSDERDRLDHDVGVGHEVLVVGIGPEGDRPGVVGVVPVEQRKEGAGIHDNAHQGASPSSSSWRSEMSLRPESKAPSTGSDR